MKKQTCCFYGTITGQIRYVSNEHPDCFRLKKLLAEEIKTMIERGITRFITGMVRGPDMWCAEIVLDLKRKIADKDIQLKAFLPYEEQAARWNTADREKYFNILVLADDVITLQTRYSPDCMYKHKRLLIDSSTHLIAVHDSGKGISNYMINYAMQKGLHVLSIHPETLERQYFSGLK